MKLYGRIEPWGIKEISEAQFNRLKAEGYTVRHFYGVGTVWDVIDAEKPLPQHNNN